MYYMSIQGIDEHMMMYIIMIIIMHATKDSGQCREGGKLYGVFFLIWAIGLV